MLQRSDNYKWKEQIADCSDVVSYFSQKYYSIQQRVARFAKYFLQPATREAVNAHPPLDSPISRHSCVVFCRQQITFRRQKKPTNEQADWRKNSRVVNYCSSQEEKKKTKENTI